ncbi:hypothetical protein FS749_007866, partial [Ceratobasidium sp. UAMH 11750]
MPAIKLVGCPVDGRSPLHPCNSSSTSSSNSINHSIMYFKPFVAIFFAASAAATPIHPRQDSLSGFLQQLEQQGLTSAVTVFNQSASTQTGQQIVSNLQNGNHTVLVPSNSAIDAVLPTLGNDTDTIATILSYHVINGSYPAS